MSTGPSQCSLKRFTQPSVFLSPTLAFGFHAFGPSPVLMVAALLAAGGAGHSPGPNSCGLGLLASSVGALTENPLGRDAGTAMLLALKGLPDTASEDGHARGGKYAPEAEFQLDRSMRNLQERAVLARHRGAVTVAA